MRRATFALSVLPVLATAACTRLSSPPDVGDPAPAFSLVSSDGSVVALADVLAVSNALLYFNMAYG